MVRRRNDSIYSPHFKRPKPPEDEGWRATFLLIFAIMGLLGAGSVLMIARTAGALDAAGVKHVRTAEGPTADGVYQRLASLQTTLR